MLVVVNCWVADQAPGRPEPLSDVSQLVKWTANKKVDNEIAGLRREKFSTIENYLAEYLTKNNYEAKKMDEIFIKAAAIYSAIYWEMEKSISTRLPLWEHLKKEKRYYEQYLMPGDELPEEQREVYESEERIRKQIAEQKEIRDVAGYAWEYFNSFTGDGAARPKIYVCKLMWGSFLAGENFHIDLATGDIYMTSKIFDEIRKADPANMFRLTVRLARLVASKKKFFK